MEISAIKCFVYETLCRDYNILLDSFPTTETALKRGGKNCGIMFCLHGPRAVKFTAVWEQEKNRIFFYGADGKRYKTVCETLD